MYRIMGWNTCDKSNFQAIREQSNFQAISISPHLLDAVFLLVALYDKTQSYEKAITLLKKQTEVKYHCFLDDIITKINMCIQLLFL